MVMPGLPGRRVASKMEKPVGLAVNGWSAIVKMGIGVSPDLRVISPLASSPDEPAAVSIFPATVAIGNAVVMTPL